METLAIVATLLTATTLVGVLYTHRDGAVRAANGVAGDLVDPGARVTLVQLSTPMCARCPGTARLARSVVSGIPGASHREVDLVEHPEVASRFRVTSTPTLLVVDERGEVRSRITGAPSRATLTSTLDDLLGVGA